MSFDKVRDRMANMVKMLHEKHGGYDPLAVDARIAAAQAKLRDRTIDGILEGLNHHDLEYIRQDNKTFQEELARKAKQTKEVNHAIEKPASLEDAVDERNSGSDSPVRASSKRVRRKPS